MQTAFAVLAVAVATLAPASSFALGQAKHKEISRDACRAAALPDEFCERVGIEAHNVDAYEWNDLAAHAQLDVSRGQTACEAANLAADRVYGLGQDLRDGLFAKARGEAWADGEYLATQLGRALHTVQDNCAHAGMSNPNHAWLSLSDSCSGTTLSPDVQPAALTCAQRESAAVIAAFKGTLTQAGLIARNLDGVGGGWPRYPSREELCEFMKSGDAWNGIDTRWANAVVQPALYQQFVAGVDGVAIARDVCHGDPDALAPVQVAAPVDTSHGQPLCTKIAVMCVGTSERLADPPDDSTASEVTGGCTAGDGPVGLAVMVFALGAFRRRRRLATRS